MEKGYEEKANWETKKIQASPEEFRVAREMMEKGYSYSIKFHNDERFLHFKDVMDVGYVMRDFPDSKMEWSGETGNIVLEEKI